MNYEHELLTMNLGANASNGSKIPNRSALIGFKFEIGIP